MISLRRVSIQTGQSVESKTLTETSKSRGTTVVYGADVQRIKEKDLSKKFGVIGKDTKMSDRGAGVRDAPTSGQTRKVAALRVFQVPWHKSSREQH